MVVSITQGSAKNDEVVWVNVSGLFHDEIIEMKIKASKAKKDRMKVLVKYPLPFHCVQWRKRAVCEPQTQA